MEELLLEEIYDETDVIRDINLAHAYALKSTSPSNKKVC